MDKREKTLLLILGLVLVLLIVKSFFIDPYTPKNEAEDEFYQEVKDIIETNYTGFLYDSGLVYPRIVKISEMSERERTVKDKDGNTYVADGIYKAKIRKYILGFLPYSEERILDID
ncbi:MAG: hypothetical protein JXR88_06330 [Clostridia bacterium]|nr:hypothetical protein [Clostridia bacterium]